MAKSTRKSHFPIRKRHTRRAKPELDFIAPHSLEVCVRRLQGFAQYQLDNYRSLGTYYHVTWRANQQDILSLQVEARAIYRHMGFRYASNRYAYYEGTLAAQNETTTHVQGRAYTSSEEGKYVLWLFLLVFFIFSGIYLFFVIAGILQGVEFSYMLSSSFKYFLFALPFLTIWTLWMYSLSRHYLWYRDGLLNMLEFLLLAQAESEKSKLIGA